jgi:hypothetical protein
VNQDESDYSNRSREQTSNGTVTGKRNPNAGL